MRYVIQFVDNTSKTVDEQEGRKIIEAWAQKRSPIIIRGSAYAAHYISAIKTRKDWVMEEDERARKDGGFLCRYGNVHKWKDGGRCGCREAGFLPMPKEEYKGLKGLPEPMREVVQLPEAPQTPEEKKRAQAYQEKKKQVVHKMTMPSYEPVKGCKDCDGTGKMTLQGNKVTCVCISNQMFSDNKK